MDTLAQVRTISDPVERVRAVNDAIEHNNGLRTELSAIKRETVRQMVAEHGGPETARRLGVTRARVNQIVNGRKRAK